MGAIEPGEKAFCISVFLTVVPVQVCLQNIYIVPKSTNFEYPYDSNSSSVNPKLSSVYGTQSLNTAFTTACGQILF